MKKRETRRERRKNREAAQELKQKDRRSDLLRSIGGSLLMAALGVLLLLRPDFGTATVASVLGWVLIAGGGICIAVSLLNRDVLGLPELLVGVAVAAVGIFIVIKPLFLASSFGILMGIYTAVHGVISLFEGLRLRKLGYSGLTSLILGGVMLVLGISMILVPMSFSRLLLRIFGGMMVVCGAGNLLTRTVAARNLRRGGETEEDT